MADVPDLPDDFATLWFLVRRVASLYDKLGEALFRRRLGISLAQFLVLSVVDAHPGMINQQAIADRLGLTKGTVSRQIDNAVAAGLMTVGTSPHSRREHVIALTTEGTALVRHGDDLFAEARRSGLSNLDADEVPITIRTLSTLNDALSTISTESDRVDSRRS
jgi:DNA-binding MarR family transcriptional regulator